MPHIKLALTLSLAALVGIAGCGSSNTTGTGGNGGTSATTTTGVTVSVTSGTGGMGGMGGSTISLSSSTGGAGGAATTSSSSGSGGTGGATSSSTSSSSSGTGGATSSVSSTSTSSSTSSSGAGGAVAGSSSSSSGGTMCTLPGDCPAPPNACVTATCVASQCGTSFVAAGTATSMQTAGDCHTNQCDGAGNVVNAVDDTDVPDDHNPCTADACSGGTPSHTPLAMGASCGTGTVCDANGNCVGCNQPTDCAGQDTECATRTCVGGMCGTSFTPAGFVTSAQTQGDCHTNQCDGAGNIESVVDDADVPADDGKQCTGEVCNAGVPSHPNLPQGTACSQGGGVKCDGNGACVACLAASDCGTSTACQTHLCAAGTCGVVNTPLGTVVSNPTPGDCRSNQCDGNGGVNVNAIDNTDVPADDGKQCTGEVCAAGTPQHPNLPQGTACSQGGGTECNGSGACVQCLTAIDCGASTACQTHTCNAGACGVVNAPAGTVVSNPTPGDCRSNQCDGNGGVNVNAIDNTDVPADDGNQCTSEACNAGTPVHPPTPSGSACNQGGGTECNGAGACVQCLAAIDCGANTTCQAHTCTAGACGVVDAPAGTFVSDPTPGDCHTNQCDGAGNVVSGVDDADVPVDGNPCTDDVCTAGVPSNPPAAAGTACSQSGGTECDGAGDCVQCVSAAECPPTGNECAVAACTAGVCGSADVASGTPTSNQTPGDCQEIVCDGAGGTTSVADDADVPPDDGNPCTGETCNAGVPSHPPVAAGTVCAQNGGTACDDAGACSAVFEVVRVGDGSAALGSAATAVFLEERFATDGTLVPTGHNPLALPTTLIGLNARLVASGNATSEGALARSADGRYVTLAGYDAAVGTAGVATSASSSVNRVVGRVDAAGDVDTSTRINALISGGNPRSAVTSDGSAFWVGGSVNGVVYVTLGATGGASILASPSNVRVVDIFAGQLYGSSGSGTFVNVFTVGAGLPITAATATSLAGMPTTAGPSPYGYALVGGSTLYVADDRSIASGGGVQKWTLSGGTWTLATTFKTGITAGTRGVAAVVTGSTTTVIATVAVTSANTIVTFVDDGMNLNPTATTIATAATNTVYRGAALAPQ